MTGSSDLPAARFGATTAAASLAAIDVQAADDPCPGRRHRGYPAWCSAAWTALILVKQADLKLNLNELENLRARVASPQDLPVEMDVATTNPFALPLFSEMGIVIPS